MRAYRWIGLALLLYQAFFLNVVVPGHTRGAITLDGRHTSDTAKPCCCCCSGSTSASGDRDSKHAPSQRDRDNCAICNFAAHVTPPPVLDLKLPELELAEVLPATPPMVSMSADIHLTYYGRGPPA